MTVPRIAYEVFDAASIRSKHTLYVQMTQKQKQKDFIRIALLGTGKGTKIYT